VFWDEPEANLNPKIVMVIARTILDLATSGIQVFIDEKKSARMALRRDCIRIVLHMMQFAASVRY